MSTPDPYRAYKIGSATAALNVASEALGTAFMSLLSLEGYDSAVVVAVREAQDAVRRAQGITLDWHEKDD